jgi:hypothetical protein
MFHWKEEAMKYLLLIQRGNTPTRLAALQG